jgi:hypothetical protein
MIRISFSTRHQRAIERRATGMNGSVYCEQCGAECLSRADYELDHCVPEGVQPNANRPPLSADDGKLLCLSCHDRKTRRDRLNIDKLKRLEGKHRPIEAGPSQIARRYGIKQEPHR